MKILGFQFLADFGQNLILMHQISQLHQKRHNILRRLSPSTLSQPRAELSFTNGDSRMYGFMLKTT